MVCRCLGGCKVEAEGSDCAETYSHQTAKERSHRSAARKVRSDEIVVEVSTRVYSL